MVLPAGRQLLRSSVVSSKSVNSALDKNKVELRVLILSVLLQMLADRNSLLDQVIKVLGDLGGHTLGLQDSQDLSTSNTLDLRDTEGVSQGNTDLRGGHTLLRQLQDMLSDVLGLDLQPRRRSSLIGQSRA